MLRAKFFFFWKTNRTLSLAYSHFYLDNLLKCLLIIQFPGVVYNISKSRALCTSFYCKCNGFTISRMSITNYRAICHVTRLYTKCTFFMGYWFQELQFIFVGAIRIYFNEWINTNFVWTFLCFSTCFFDCFSFPLKEIMLRLWWYIRHQSFLFYKSI